MRWFGDLMVVVLELGYFEFWILLVMFFWEKYRVYRVYVYLGENLFCIVNLIMG